MTLSRLPVRTAAAWPAAILVATALAFVPLNHLPSFDVPKLVVVLLGAIALTFAVARRRSPAGRDDVLADPVLAVPLLLAAVALAGALLVWPRGSLVGPVTALACIAVARIAAQTDDPARAVRVVARGAAVAGAAAGTYALAQKTGLDFAPWAQRREPVATFGNTSFAAEFQAAALPLSLLLALGTARGDRLLGILGTLLGVAHLAVATSRIDLIAAAAGVGVAVCLLLHARGRSRLAAGIAIVGVAAGVALGVAFFAGVPWLGRSDTVAVRVGVWKATGAMIADAPLRIAGTPFVDRFPVWRTAEEYRISLGRGVDTPHDDYLEIAAALGVPGLLVALGVVAALARRVVAAARAHAAETAALGASLAAVAVSALASSPLSHVATALLPALAAGLVVALAPRPFRGWTLPARTADVVLLVLLALCLWPGPAWRGLRSDGFLALGRHEVEAGTPEKAFLLLDHAAEVDPQAFAARYELGSVLASAGRRDEAIAALRSALALRPGDFACCARLAYTLRDAGRLPEAKALIDESLARCPWHPLLLAARAVFALQEGRGADAVRDADRAAAGLPTQAQLAPLAAEARLVADPSEESYTQCLDALTRLFRDGQLDELGRSARSMVRRDPGLLGPLATRARRLAKSEPDLASALLLAASPAARDAGFLEDASKVLRETGREDESTILLGRSLGVRAADAYERGEYTKALKLAHQAADRDPSPAHSLLAARAAARLGEKDAAVEEIGAAVASGPVDADEIRSDPVLQGLLPDRRLEEVLDRAARRSGDNRGKPDPR